MEASDKAAASAAAPEEHQAVESLVGRAKEGDVDAFSLLYDRFQPEILRYLTNQVRHRETAEDLAQQVFLKAWQAPLAARSEGRRSRPGSTEWRVTR